MINNFFYPIGDSTWDNWIWVDDKKQTVESQIDKKLNPPFASKIYEVISQAFDGFTTQSLLEGDLVGAVLARHQKFGEYLKEKVGSVKGTKVFPLELLETAIKKNPGGNHYVALSVGGNDFRANLGKFWKLIWDVPYIQKRYIQIVDRIISLGEANKGNEGAAPIKIYPILMFQYRTDYHNDVYGVYKIFGWIGRIAIAIQAVAIATLGVSALALVAGAVSITAFAAFSALSVLALATTHILLPLNLSLNVVRGKKEASIAVFGALMKRFYAPIIEHARKNNIPILDLPNSFDPYDKDLYISGIEPSEKGGALIAEGIAHIVKWHKFDEGSEIYTKWKNDERYTSEFNNKKTKWFVV